MAIDKSTWNKKIKVSQSTINDIKSLGMKDALKLAKLNGKAYQGGLVLEYQEATRRLYGDRRFYAAAGKPKPYQGAQLPGAGGSVKENYRLNKVAKMKTGDAAKAAGARSVAKSKKK